MKVSVGYGSRTVELDIDERHLVQVERAPVTPNLTDPVQALREALEHPLDYPPLRLALTPDDHVAIFVDESTPHLAQLLIPILEHIVEAHVKPEMITLLCAPPSTGQAWLDELPEQLEEVQVEVHQPEERKKLAYLATTRHGRRVYLSRTAVDADQLVVVTQRSYDPRVGYAGAETALLAALSDEETMEEVRTQLETRAPSGSPWPIQQEAREVAWLLGAPFFVQVIPGEGDGIANILAGPQESSNAGQRLLDARWRAEIGELVDVVIATIGGSTSLDDIARAFFTATRIVKPGGSIAVLSEGHLTPGPAFDLFRRHDDPALALHLLMQEKPDDLASGYMWATAADHARLYLLSGLPEEVAEELFVIPMQHASQAQRLLAGDATCAILPDAHRMLAVLR